MAGPDKKISIRLSAGFTNRTLGEFIEPVPVQGSEPTLAASINTRLGKIPGGVARSPAATAITTASNRKWGPYSSAAGQVSILATDGDADFPVGISSSGTSVTGGSTPFAGVGAGSAITARVIYSGDLDGAEIAAPIASVYDTNGNTVWRAYQTLTTANTGVWICAEDLSGAQVLQSTFLATLLANTSTSVLWSGITHHGVYGTYIWYQDAAKGICCQRITLDGRSVVFVAATTVALPGQMLVQPDVCSFGQYAYLVCAAPASTTDGVVIRIDMSTAAVVSSTSVSNVLNGGGTCSVDASTISDNDYVAVAFSRLSDRTSKLSLMTSTLGLVGTPVTLDGAGPSTLVRHGASSWFFAVSNFKGDFSTDAYTIISSSTPLAANTYIGTFHYVLAVPSWTARQTGQFPWMHLHGKGVSWKRDGANDSSRFPVIPMMRRYGTTPTKVRPGDSDYVDDPCVVYYAFPSPISNATPMSVARLGCVRGTVAAALTFDILGFDTLSSRGDVIVGDKLVTTWRKLGSYGRVGGFGRSAILDLSPSQPIQVADKDGKALVAGAIPLQYDAFIVRPMGGWLFAPRLAVKQLTSFATTPSGVYRFAAVYRWSDASGVEWRSRPSNLLTVTVTGTSDGDVRVIVAVDLAYYIGVASAHAFVDLYASEVNDTVMRYLSSATVYITPCATSLLVLSAALTIPDASPQIYTTASDGEEIPGQPPPPLRSISIVGSRAWGIDAEFPTRIVYSKLRVAGVGYEWFPAGEVILPSGAGEGMAIREWAGIATILAQRGVYQVSGDGPNNNASAGSYSTPVKVSDIGCSNTASVVEYPGGIMWQSGSRFVRMGASIAYDTNMLCTHDVSAAVCMPRYDEVLFFSATLPEIRVYNYVLDRWTVWDNETLAVPITSALATPWNRDMVLAYSLSNNAIYRIDADSVSTAQHMTFETDWILADADFQSPVILREVVFSGAIAGPHALEINVRMDYEAKPSTFETWSSAELAAIAKDGRYTVRKEVTQPNGRAFKVQIRDVVAPGESNPAGLSPRPLTLVFARDDGTLFEEAFIATSRK